MIPLELLGARWDAPCSPADRALRTGARAAGVGVTALAAARRLRRLGAPTTAEVDRERALVLRDACRRALELHGVAVDLQGALPIGPVLLVSNHVSWLDPMVIASVVPCVPISKLDVSRWPVIGALARDLGVLFVARGEPRSGARVLRGAASALAARLPVLNFPEGTTTRGDEVLPFRPGLFGVARSAGVQVVPAAIAYDPPELAWVGDDAFLPHWLGVASQRCARAVLRLGDAIGPAEHASAAELAEAARDAVRALLAPVR